MTDETSEGSTSCSTIAAFDFDGTLTRGGSVVPFLAYLRGWRSVVSAAIPLAPSFARAGIASGRAADHSKERLLTKLLAGMEAERVADQGKAFAKEHLSRRLRPQMAATVEHHRQVGHRLVVVSASPELYVRPAARELGIEDVIATRLSVDGSGLLTGRFEGLNCRGDEKIRRLSRWLDEHVPSSPLCPRELWAYGNSRGDLKMLAAADHPVDAGRLGRFGRLRHYPSLRAARPLPARRPAPFRLTAEQPGAEQPGAEQPGAEQPGAEQPTDVRPDRRYGEVPHAG